MLVFICLKIDFVRGRFRIKLGNMDTPPGGNHSGEEIFVSLLTGDILKGKNLLSMESKFFPLRLSHLKKGFINIREANTDHLKLLPIVNWSPNHIDVALNLNFI